MFTFVHPALLWGLAAVALPLLIHLINVLRHRRVQWAAMEFLLASQRRNQKSVLLKQLLLLLLRMAAVAAAVLMVAGPQLSGDLGGWLGAARTHHIVLLDDSYSMSDRVADEEAFQRAGSAVRQIVEAAQHESTPQSLTLIRYSHARRNGGHTDLDWQDASLASGFSVGLADKLATWSASETAGGARQALDAVESLSAAAIGENRVLYLVSDFRSGEWDEAAELRKSLQRLTEAGARLHLVNCSDAVHDNLAIATLAPAAQGVRAAGVPTVMEVGVTNYGGTAAKGVGLTVQPDRDAPVPIEIEEIPAGKTVTRRFSVLFDTAGQHELAVHLESDAVAADNTRYAVIGVQSQIPILLVDGDPAASDAKFIATALSPAGKTRTGLAPKIESPRYLGSAPLGEYAAIFLCNVARLDEAEIAALETYVSAGGGLAFFLGERTAPAFINEQLYREGKGLFPAPITDSTELLVDRLEKTPDVELTDHPVFAVFAGERNSLIGTVNVERFFPVRRDWAAAADSTVQVIARLRNRAPLVLEQQFGEGRVVAFLTKASPVATAPSGSWNNWGRDNPSYVVTLLELEAYLAGKRTAVPERLVAEPIEVRFSPAEFDAKVRFVPPQSKSGSTLLVDAETDDDESVASYSETDFSGIYQAQLTPPGGELETRLFAVNVLPSEGNLARLDGTQLAARLSGLDYQYHDWATLNFQPHGESGANLGQTILYVLVGMLLAEQLLAYACTYHPRRAAGAPG